MIHWLSGKSNTIKCWIKYIKTNKKIIQNLNERKRQLTKRSMPKQLVKASLGKKLMDNSDRFNKGWNSTNNSDSGSRREFGDDKQDDWVNCKLKFKKIVKDKLKKIY